MNTTTSTRPLPTGSLSFSGWFRALIPVWKLLLGFSAAVIFVFIARSATPTTSTVVDGDVAKQVAAATKTAVSKEMKVAVKDLNEIVKSMSDSHLASAGTPLAKTRSDEMATWKLFFEAEAAWKAKRADEAIEKLNAALEADSANVEAINLLARIHAEKARNGEAMLYFRQALTLDAVHYGSLLGMTTLLLNEKKCEDVKPFLERLKKRVAVESHDFAGHNEVAQRVKRYAALCEPALETKPSTSKG